MQISGNKKLKISLILKKKVYAISLNTLSKVFNVNNRVVLLGVENEEKGIKGYYEKSV